MSDLEIIPEDTSQTTPKITSRNTEKIKDPKHVAAGKRIAAISKEAKQKKARDKFEAEVAAQREASSSNIDYGYVVGTVGILAEVGALYFAYRQERRETTRIPPSCEQEIPSRPHVSLDTFD